MSVHNFPSPKTSPGVSSVSRRFSYTLIGVVTLLLIAFAAVGIFLGVAKIENKLKTRLDNDTELALKVLPKPLWNIDYDVVNEFVEALFLNESIVYTKISWGDKIVAERKRPDFKLQRLQLPVPHGSEFIAKTSDIFFETNKVAEILIVMSRESVKKQALLQIYGTIALTLLIIAAIWITSIVITKRYISRPLLKLQQAASLIARGDLDTLVDKSSSNEIGVLGKHLDAMRASIKQLFEELSESKEKLEEYSRTLEQKVEARTQELSWSVEELTRNEEALRESRATARGLLDATQESLLLLDKEGIIIAVNQTAARRHQRTPEELIGTNRFELLPQNLRESRRFHFSNVLQTGNPVDFEDVRDGMVFHHIYYPVQDKTGAIIGVAIFAQDITEGKHMEEELTQNVEELERFRKLAIGREIKMIQLKEEINELLDQSGQGEKYKIV
jgi:PAS domain S-box-containing protein